MALPADLPRWAETAGGTPSANITAPTGERKDVGWANSMEPPAGTLNWWMWNVYKWISALKDLFLGAKSVKKLQVDGTGGAATSVSDGNIEASGTIHAATLVSAPSVTASGVSTAARVRAIGNTVTSADFTLGVGWGNTATIFVATGSTDTAGTLTVTCGGAAIAASPRIIMTFNGGTFPANGAIQIVNHTDSSETANSGPIYGVVIKPSLTAPQWFMVGTPVDTKTYTFNWHTISL